MLTSRDTFKSVERSETILLVFVLLIAVFLRFYNFFQLPFMHDELSALSRLRFSDFSDLIQKGIVPDGHPAGVQVFLYYWTSLVGTSEWAVKLPFTLMGIASVYLVYLIGKNWFNPTTALLSAGYIASLQFPLTYSPIARPYISGLFFSLVLVWFWSQLISGRKRNELRNYIGFALALALCAYNHHFSLLVAFIVGLSGLWFLKKINLKFYFASIILAVILYLPHFPIFFAQLENQGLSWLAEPDYYFFIQYLSYIFHYSWLVFLSLVGVLIAGVLNNRSDGNNRIRMRIVSFFLFILPVVIGYLYSVYVMPVIQFSMLLFTMPFLFLFLFSFLESKSFKFNFIALLLIFFVNIFTLFHKRDHFKIMREQPFNVIAEEFHDINYAEDSIKVLAFFLGNDNYLGFYLDKFDRPVDYQSFIRDRMNPHLFREILENKAVDQVLSGNLPLEYHPIIKEYYPFVVKHRSGFTFDFWRYSKHSEDNNARISSGIFKEVNPFYNAQSQFIEEPVSDFSIAYKAPLNTIADSRFLILDISVEVKPLGEINEARLVNQILINGESKDWRESKFTHFIDVNKNEWQVVYLSNRIVHSIKNSRDFQNAEAEIIIWNEYREHFEIRNLSLSVRPDDNSFYGLFYPMR